jgi:hypothetical protein
MALTSFLSILAVSSLGPFIQNDGAEVPNRAISSNCATDTADGDSESVPDETRQLSALIGVHNCWKADPNNDKLYFLNDLYARWIIEEMPSTGTTSLVRDYKREKRSPVARFFVGKASGAIMSVKIHVRDPDIDFTVPLVAIDYNGRSGQGQAFVTTITNSDMGLPDFRLSPNSSVAIEATARLTDEVDVQAAGVVLAAVRDTLAIASPAGSLLTSINRDQVQRVSSAYDSTFSKLLSTTISESTSVGRLMSEWYPQSSIIVSVNLPENIKTINQSQNRRLVFRISMACHRLSVFDAATVCQSGVLSEDGDNMRVLINSPYKKGISGGRQVTGRPGFASIPYANAVAGLGERVNAHQVLNFRLGIGKTLRQYMTEQEWFIGLSKKMVDPDKDTVAAANQAVSEGSESELVANDKKLLTPAKAAADEFCKAVVDRLFSAGLSRLDSQIGLWAIATGIPDFSASRGFFQNAAGCVEYLPGQSWRYASDVQPSSR